jgi:hypothetical protein
MNDRKSMLLIAQLFSPLSTAIKVVPIKSGGPKRTSFDGTKDWYAKK